MTPDAILTLALINLPDSLTGLTPLVTVVADEDSEAVSCNRSLVFTVIVDAAFTKGLTPNMLALKPGKGSISSVSIYDIFELPEKIAPL